MGAIYHGGTKYGGIGFDSFASIDDGTLLYTFSADSSSTTNYDHGSWTATDDCFVVGFLRYANAMGTDAANLYINSVRVAYTHATITGSYTINTPICYPVKKGQSVEVRTAAGYVAQIKAYKAKKSSPQQMQQSTMVYPDFSNRLQNGTFNYSSHSDVTILYDGFLKLTFQRSNSGNTKVFVNNSSYPAASLYSPGNYLWSEVVIPIKKNDVLSFDLDSAAGYDSYWSVFGVRA